jgi:GTP-binding protein
MSSIRNIAIIAHVDHGKTTLVDALLKQSGTFQEHQEVVDRALDRNDLERERGITILAKCTSIHWKDTRINIVDTPGHADFGGEVERILSMVDGVVLLVDAAEGPMPQTKFVVTKALALGLRPIVVINKIDRSDQRADEVLDEVFDLFVSLDATEEQLDFPVFYASSRQGWAVRELTEPQENLHCLYEEVISYVKPPVMEKEVPFQMLATMIEADPYLGRILVGKVDSGTVSMNQTVKVMNLAGDVVETGRITKILMHEGLNRVPVESASAGDIIALAGLQKALPTDTLADQSIDKPMETQPIDPPTLTMTFMVNDSPYAGQEGSKVTSRILRDRLFKEAECNVALKVSESESKDAFEVAGRGELQMGVLIETMRREGFELAVSQPRIIFRTDEETGERLEPIEEVYIDVDDDFTGVVVEKMNLRKGNMTEMRPSGGGKTRIIFEVPSRGLIGYHGEFLTDTRGTGIMNRLFLKYGPYVGKFEGRRNGALISNGQGTAVAYALWYLENSGQMFIEPGEKLYQGMVIGENSRNNDLEVNPLKTKQLSNVRASGKDDAIRLTPIRKMTLEQAISYINSDELVEVTPENIRIRKYYLDPNVRKRMAKTNG